MFGIPNRLHETLTFSGGSCYDDQFQTIIHSDSQNHGSVEHVGIYLFKATTRWSFHVVFSSPLGEDPHFDEHIFQMAGSTTN